MASNAACMDCTCAATRVEMRWKRLGANAPPKPRRLSTHTPAEPSPVNHRKHCVQRSACWIWQNLYADSASTTYDAARVCSPPAVSQMARPRA